MRTISQHFLFSEAARLVKEAGNSRQKPSAKRPQAPTRKQSKDTVSLFGTFCANFAFLTERAKFILLGSKSTLTFVFAHFRARACARDMHHVQNKVQRSPIKRVIHCIVAL